MFNKFPLVSVIIPVYNGEKYLKEAIDSVLDQTYKKWELIIVNDASGDNTEQIALEYVRKNNRIKLLKHTINKFRSGALNTGIANAKGSFICFLDADDIYFKDKLEKQVNFLTDNSHIDMVYGDIEVFDDIGTKHLPKAISFKEDPKKILMSVAEKEIEPGAAASIILGHKNNYSIIPSCSIMIRKKVFEKVRFDERLKTSQDYDLWFQIIGQGFKIAKLPILTYRYRAHPGQISKTKTSETTMASANLIISKLKSWEYFKIPGVTKPKILLVPNVPNWAFDFEADQIIKHYGDQFDFKKKFHADLMIGGENYSKYDRIFVFFWPATKQFLNKLTPAQAKEKLIVGIFSFNSWEGRKNEAKDIFKKCRAVVTNNKKIFEEFKSKDYPIYYVKKWVDESHFKPENNNCNYGKLIVGWSGNPNHVDKNYKGYWNILLPVCEKNKDWIDFRPALKDHNPIPYKKMPKYYNSLDVITCLSKAETGPNSLLEAAACGIPAITVNVGVASELIINNDNGIIIKREQKSLEDALRKLYDDRNLIQKMGKKIRLKIVKDWTCDKNIKEYKKVFDLN